METIAITGEARTDTGKKSTKAVRKNGGVPCVIYGADENVHFSASVKAFKELIYSPKFKTAEITVNGNTHKAFIKDMQFHPVTDGLLHIDFQALTDGQPVLTELPIRLVGRAVGVAAGGKLMTKVRKLKVKVLPQHLVPEIVVDVSHLDIGKSVRVRDVELEGVQLMQAPAIPIASVEITRALRAAQAAAGKESEKGGAAAPAAE